MPMRRRARRNSRLPSVVISMSFSVTVPAVGSTSRLMQRMTVDLPAPEGPISAITLPRKLKERLLDLLDQLRLEVVGIAVAAGREGLRLVDRADFRRFEHLAVKHPVEH